jgi:REP element-mobilizing transposase RayT
MSLSDVVHRFKSLTTTQYRRGVREQAWTAFRGRLWQRNYYEHIIRDDREWDDIREYIVDNPRRWAEDAENARNLR